jgi:membrane protein DedA with SNARE-associated domain
MMHLLTVEHAARYATPVIFINLSLGIAGVPALSETLLVVTGALASHDHGSFMPAWIAAVMGSAVGMRTAYQIGWLGERAWRRRRWLARAREHWLARATGWSRRFGPLGVVVGYFVPGMRHLAAIAAGAAALNRPVFMTSVVSGASLWAGLLLWSGFLVGDPRTAIARWHPLALVVALPAMVIASSCRAARRAPLEPASAAEKPPRCA